MRMDHRHADQIVETVGYLSNVIDVVDDNIQIAEKQGDPHRSKDCQRNRIGLLSVIQEPAKTRIQFLVELDHTL